MSCLSPYVPPIATAEPAKWAFSETCFFYRGTADMTRVSKRAFRMRLSACNSRTRCTNDIVHAAVLNYRPMCRYLTIPVIQRCLSPAYWEGTLINLVDHTSQASIKALDMIIHTSRPTRCGRKCRRRR